MEQNKQTLVFLCTGNSARSIFAEYLTNKICGDRFEAYSAGSQARSKSWDEFKGTQFDIVITVCDNAKESCPVFPGQPIIAHWSIPDPAEATDTDEQKLRTFRETAQQIQRRIELLCSFPIEKLGHLLTQPNQETETTRH